MEEAGVTPSEVQYINAHGTSTHHNDLFETYAIKRAFGDAAKDLVVNSTKSMIGHLLGAAGAVECVTCVKSIQDGFVHATAGLKVDDPECDLDYTPNKAVKTDLTLGISDSFGFGGHDACVAFRKYEG